MSDTVKLRAPVTRRRFIVVSAAAGGALILGVTAQRFRHRTAAISESGALNAFVRSLGDLDASGQARAAIARRLANKMDGAGTGATSLALLSRELRSVLCDMVDPSRDTKAADLIARIFDA